MYKKQTKRSNTQSIPKLSPKDIKLFNEFIKNIDIKNIDTKNNNESLKQMCTVMREYLNNFMVVGYDSNNERVCISYNRNQKDSDSLNELLRFTVYNILDND